MSDTIIKVEGLGKKYVIGHQTGLSRRQSYKRFSDVLLNAAKAPVRAIAAKWGNFQKLGSGNESGLPAYRHSPFSALSAKEDFWALKEVSFEIKRGDVVGIIGRNGAGKSTLLKILSRITEPTTGQIEIDGRVASLLEVGTGFHPELSGRENIFLNGAILGMTRAEIRRKFDEIVAFAEVENFLDTPVKRYSSGMYVRLAFAVAAHLEPEILVVDEVLAVGDAQFQKKCLGKMQDVSRQDGRTVLFVSHNMGAVQNLCSRGLVLTCGKVAFDGKMAGAIDSYNSSTSNVAAINLAKRVDRKGAGNVRFIKSELLNSNRQPIAEAVTGSEVIIRLHYASEQRVQFRACRVSLAIGRIGTPLILASSELISNEEVILKSNGYIDCIIPNLPLTKGEYSVMLYLESAKEMEDWIDNGFTFTVSDGDFYGTGRDYPVGWEGRTVLVKHSWLFE